MKTRYAITKLDNSGLRVLACANQGRNHHDTRQEAEKALAAILNPSVNSADTLKSVFGDVSQMKVLAVPCYDHGDAMHTVFSDDKPRKPYQPKTGAACSCKRGVQRDNCPQCEGTGMRIDFAAIRTRQRLTL